MKLTEEQLKIIQSEGNIRINAVAGSGKTTTLIEYAKSRPQGSKILYIAFNKTVREEATKKFKENGLIEVRVATAHSLAFDDMVRRGKYALKQTGSYKATETAEILSLQGTGEMHSEFVIANHVNKFVSHFCNSDKAKVENLNYADTIKEPKAKQFIKNIYPYLEKQTRIFLGKMDRGEIEITHDFYLKKYQLLNPVLNYDYILFDEGQDASAVMLDIFLKQKACKVIVGDSHQQIYAWRGAVNSLEQVDFPDYYLSTSFRFGTELAGLAQQILSLKGMLTNFQVPSIFGKGISDKTQSKAIIARTNLGLLLKAIEYTEKNPNITKIYFEGNISSYTYAEDGASLYDVLNLNNKKRDLIRDKIIRGMEKIEDLDHYIEKTEDKQLGMMVEIVKKYGNKIPGIIRELKDMHTDEKQKAQVIFSTVHKCKGMEYDQILLADDFVTKETIEKILEEKEEKIDREKLNEEINLLYVAVTRTRNRLIIPESLLPEAYVENKFIRPLREEYNPKKQFEYYPSSLTEVSETLKPPKTKQENIQKLEEIKSKNKAAYLPWSEELDEELTLLFCDGVSIKALSVHFARTPGAIQSRIKKLELREKYS
jgi:F-box protein, helicase, 18